MMWNVTLCRHLVFEDAIEAESEEEAVQIAMEHNSYDELNWRRNGPTQVVCVEPAYDGSEAFGMLITDSGSLYDSLDWDDDVEGPEWALD